MSDKRVVAIIQARMSSVRLPGKVLKKIGDVRALEMVLRRLEQCQSLTKIVVATSDNERDAQIQQFCDALNVACVRGDEFDVLSRFRNVLHLHPADYIVRITADCPFIAPELIDEAVDMAVQGRLKYVSNSHPPTFPDGLDLEVVEAGLIIEADEKADSKFDREHVTPWVRDKFADELKNIANAEDFSDIRLTLDDEDDLRVINKFYSYVAPRLDFTWDEMARIIKEHRNEFTLSASKKRNEGADMSSGQKLYKRAKEIIPGGNMLLSKRPEMFLPDLWPSYFSKAKGCHVWDLDDNKLTDMSIMGIGTNSLGYGHPEVDEAVAEVVAKGNMSTLNAPEEVYLAEKLIEMHPWADMARFARSGGEANAIATRIARAASKRDVVAICGYHGWHDWYLAVNLASGKNLDGHLLPGLEPQGVPKGLEDSVVTFTYGDVERVEALLKSGEVGTVCMEVARSETPYIDFLKQVRALCDKYNAILIFDECTSGFRQTYGGLHLEVGIEPDMAMFGKALGNGYAVTAVIGRAEIMSAAQNTFISSTFWTERIGSAAALKTLEVMEKTKSFEQITKTGKGIKSRWQALAQSYGLKMNIFGLDALAGFSFVSENALIYKTFITQEMLKKGFLASNLVYVSTAHSEAVIDEYMTHLAPLFEKIAEMEQSQNIEGALDGSVCHSGFKRLN